MKTYWITFRIADKTVGGRTYQERYEALVAAVQAHSATHWWAEPTSFWLVNSQSSQADIAASIRKSIAPTTDLALIGMIDFKGLTLVGNAEYLADLKALAPNLVQA